MSKIPAFSERLQKITLRNRRKVHVPGKPWPIDKRVEVVSHWLVLGNMKQVAAVTGVPYDLIRKWKAEQWWTDMVAEIRATQNLELDHKMSNIVNKSLDAVLDRVENGDFIYDQKSGEIRRKPAALRDLHRVSVDILTKREVIRTDAPTENSKTTVQDHLKMLAQEMAKWNKTQERTIDLVEVEDAIYSVAEGEATGVHEGSESEELPEEGRETDAEQKDSGTTGSNIP